MKILTGLFEHMVLQRNRRGVSEALITGTTTGDGIITGRVKQNGKGVKGFAGVEMGQATRGFFRVVLKGLPAGGPYAIELALAGAKETHVVRDVLVGDVWLLGGQSNMQGIGWLPNGLEVDPLVRGFYMNDRWANAKDPLHNMWEAVDQVHADLCGGFVPAPRPNCGACPGVAFGQQMREYTGVPQGVIACAHGGTTMAQWDPKLKKLGSRSLYGATIRRLVRNGGKVAGLVWYQGCSDANAAAAPLYTKNMKAFVAALRRDTRSPDLPVALVQIARVVGWGPETVGPWNSIQDQQRRLPQVIPHCTTVPAVDLAMDDCIHISGSEQIRLGRRLAQAMQVLRGDRKAGLPPIELKTITLVPDEMHGELMNVVVEFDNVQGDLESGSRPAGFEIVGQTPGTHWYDLKLKGNRAILRSTLPLEALSNMHLHHGYGVNPYCNITDTADRSLPVFGPIRIGEPKALSAFVRSTQISRVLPSAGKLQGLAYPKKKSDLGLTPKTFTVDFCDRHAELASRGPEDVLVYYLCKIDCTEPMKLMIRLGYDGPVKLWVDGEERLHDPDGVNPAFPNKALVPFAATAGRHELLVAMSSNHGRAWGIFLRFERLDVTKAKLKLGPEHYRMPVVVGNS